MVLIETEIRGIDSLNSAERRWIADFRADGHRLLNATSGGDGVRDYAWTDEQKAHASDTHSGSKNYWHGRTLSAEHRQRISDATMGREPWNKGRETPQLAGSNNPMFGVHRFGSKSPHFGKPHSDETKTRISEANKGRTPPNKGTPMADSQKQKLRESALARPPMSAEHKAAIGRGSKGHKASETQRESARLANHKRWHVARDIKKTDCKFCINEKESND